MGDLAIRRFAYHDGPLDEFLQIPRMAGRVEGAEADQEEEYARGLLDANNSFHRNAESMNFLAWQGDKPIGRLTAFHNRLLNDYRGRVGTLGLFYCENDMQVFKSLLGMAITWMEAQGLNIIRGPLDGDVWHKWRFMVRGFDTAKFPAEPRHPDYYPEMFLSMGFAPVRTYCTRTILDPQAQLERFDEAVKNNLQRGITVADVPRDQLDKIMPDLHDVYVNAMASVWSSTSASLDEFTTVFKRHINYIKPEYVVVARDRNGGAVGLGMAVASPPDTVNLLTVVALPSQAGMCLGQFIANEIYRLGLANGAKVFQHCMLDPLSPAQRWDHGAAAITREYMLYERPL